MQTDPVRGARVGIMDLLVGQHRDKYIFQMEHSSQNEDWKELRPGYIPEGFELVGEEESIDTVLLSYRQVKQFINIMISNYEQIMIYGESTDSLIEYRILSDGTVVTVYQQDDIIYYNWILGQVYFSVCGNIARFEIEKIAESIQWRQ